MSTPEEQVAAAVQQLNVRPQQQETMATFLQAERDDFASQVQSPTSTIMQKQPGVVGTRVIGRPDEFDGDPMRCQLEPMTTEASSTPRLSATLSSEASCLSTQMYYILVMTTTGSASDKCHSAGMNEGFEARKQFVMDSETEFVGFLMNVLSTKLAAFERLVHKSQPSETVCDDTKTGVTVLGDGGHAGQSVLHPEERKDHELDTDARGNPRDHGNTIVH